MTTAIIGTGGIGSAIARRLASGGEALRLASVDNASARRLATEIGRAAVGPNGRLEPVKSDLSVLPQLGHLLHDRELHLEDNRLRTDLE